MVGLSPGVVIPILEQPQDDHHVQKGTHKYVYTCKSTYNICTCAHESLHVWCASVSICMYAYMNICVHENLCASEYVQVHVCINVHEGVCMHASLNMCMYLCVHL